MERSGNWQSEFKHKRPQLEISSTQLLIYKY
jgi:hypothetical protein